MKGNLLIIDDETQLLRMLSLMLQEHCDEVFVAEDGHKGIEIFASNEIHCVICDINMPGLNGIEVIKEIRKLHNDVPFIFFTGHGNYELMLEAAKYGAFDFLNKPEFDRLDDVVIRGLRAGVSPKMIEPSPEENLSSYRKLLERLDS